jgi:hypothetical protein
MKTLVGRRVPSDSPEVARLETKLAELSTQLQALEEKDRQTEERIASRRRANATDAAAEALLAGKPMATAKDSDRESLGEIRREKKILRRAIEMLKQDVNAAQHAAAVEIATAELPEYRAAVAAMAKALVPLGDASLAMQKIRDDQESRGVLCHVTRPMAFHYSHRSLMNAIEAWQQEAKEHKLI